MDANDLKFTWNEIMHGVTSTISTSDDGNTSPTMVFSVIGDSDSFVPRPWPKTVFQTALIEAAKSGGGKSLSFDSEHQVMREKK